MKTRSNMPLYVVECSNVKELTDDQINLLRCGDYLVKKDASGEHAYKVTFKSATGLCLTYYDASVIETQSYDLVDGHWVYNSEDKTPLPINGELTEDVLLSGDVTFDGDATFNGDVNGESNPSFKPIYWHTIKFQRGGTAEEPTVGRIFGYLIILNNSSTPFTLDEFKTMLATEGVSFVLHSGYFSSVGGSDLQDMAPAMRLIYSSINNFNVEYLNTAGQVLQGGGFGIDTGWTLFQDLGANKIN